jgi:hypothetical protein
MMGFNICTNQQMLTGRSKQEEQNGRGMWNDACRILVGKLEETILKI